MTVSELIAELVQGVDSGELDPNAVVVRPLGDEVWVEAKFLDQVRRKRLSDEEEGDGWISPARFASGSVPEPEPATLTLKLG